MNMYISPLERIILESIQRKNKTNLEIANDTNINAGILQNIIHSVLIKGLIKFDGNSFEINNNLPKEVIESLKNKENLILECNEVIRASIKLSIKDEENKGFRLKKSSLNESQQKLLQAMLFNIESFLEDCDQENKNMKTKDKTVIFWGSNSYENLTKNILESI